MNANNDAFGIKRDLVTTVHATMAVQPTVDGSLKKDWRGGCVAAKAVTKMIPIVKAKLTGMAYRVPTIDVSAVDLTCGVKKETSYEESCAGTKRRSEGDMRAFEAIAMSPSCPRTSYQLYPQLYLSLPRLPSCSTLPSGRWRLGATTSGTTRAVLWTPSSTWRRFGKILETQGEKDLG